MNVRLQTCQLTKAGGHTNKDIIYHLIFHLRQMIKNIWKIKSCLTLSLQSWCCCITSTMQTLHIYDLNGCQLAAAQQWREGACLCTQVPCRVPQEGFLQLFGHWCKCWSSYFLFQLFAGSGSGALANLRLADRAFLSHKGQRQFIPYSKLHLVSPQNHILFDWPFRTLPLIERAHCEPVVWE